MQLRGDHLDFAGRQFGIGLAALHDFALDGDDKFAAHLLGLRVRFGLRLLVEDYLHDAGAVAHVEEKQIAEVAPAVDPAHDRGVAAIVGGAQRAAVMRSFQITEKIEHGFISPKIRLRFSIEPACRSGRMSS